MKYIGLDEKTIKLLNDYLGSRPFAEVINLVNEIGKNAKVIEVPDAQQEETKNEENKISKAGQE